MRHPSNHIHGPWLQGWALHVQDPWPQGWAPWSCCEASGLDLGAGSMATVLCCGGPGHSGRRQHSWEKGVSPITGALGSTQLTQIRKIHAWNKGPQLSSRRRSREGLGRSGDQGGRSGGCSLLCVPREEQMEKRVGP